MPKKTFKVSRRSGHDEVISYVRAVCEEAILAAYEITIEITLPNNRAFNNHIPFMPAEAACEETGK